MNSVARRQPRPFCGLNRATEGEAGTQGGIESAVVVNVLRGRPGRALFTVLRAGWENSRRLSFEAILINAPLPRLFEGMCEGGVPARGVIDGFYQGVIDGLLGFIFFYGGRRHGRSPYIPLKGHCAVGCLSPPSLPLCAFD